MNKNNIDLVIYHRGCTDGFGSAFAVWKYFNGNNNTRIASTTLSIEYISANYNEDPPDVRGRNVLICDFSYKYNVLLNMIEQANSLLVIDHHISAEKELKNIDNKYKLFDMNHSGAYLTWVYFFPNEEVPDLIKFIEDRDLWKHEIPNTHQFFALFKNLPFDFNIYNGLLNKDSLNKAIKEGSILYNCDVLTVKRLAKHSVCKFTKLVDGNYYNIAYLNSNMYKSELGNYLVEKQYPECDFAIIYSYDDKTNKTWFSLRSSDKKTDVSYIAKLYDGGGHRNAAGITLKGLHCEIAQPMNY